MFNRHVSSHAFLCPLMHDLSSKLSIQSFHQTKLLLSTLSLPFPILSFHLYQSVSKVCFSHMLLFFFLILVHISIMTFSSLFFFSFFLLVTLYLRYGLCSVLIFFPFESCNCFWFSETDGDYFSSVAIGFLFPYLFFFPCALNVIIRLLISSSYNFSSWG